MAESSRRASPEHNSAWRISSRSILLLLLGLTLLGCGGEGARRELRGATMGTTWSVVYADSGTIEPQSLQRTIEDELQSINQSLSTYIPDSEISRLNDSTDGAPIAVSAGFAAVLDAALAISGVSEGAYDVTVGPLVELWGFGSRAAEDRVPDAEDIAQALAKVGSQRLAWDRETRLLGKPAGMSIDLSSIAKGYAVDRLTALLQAAGVRDFLVEIGGELRTAGERPGGGAWRLAIESPRPSASRVLEALAVSDAAVATSGDYRNYFEVDGVRYSHLVDPRTGFPVAHELVSVTVIHGNCMEADGWATALIVMGRDGALQLARERGLAVYLVWRDGEQLAVDYTPEFSDYLVTGSQANAPGDPDPPG